MRKWRKKQAGTKKIANMRILSVLAFLFLSLFAFSQQVDPAEVAKIKKEIVEPLNNGEVDKVLDRMVFPFKAGSKSYTRAELKKDFSTIFVSGIGRDLNGSGYEAMNFDGDAYMMVCMAAPDGYEAAVPVFKKIDGVWMFAKMDLYAE